MQSLQASRLKSSRNNTSDENSTHTTDESGIVLNATPSYDREYDSLLTIEEATAEIALTDGGTETVVEEVYRCGECGRVFDAEGVLSSYIVEATGEQVSYSTGQCPHCDTPITNARTVTSRASFDLPARETEGDR